MAAVKLDIYYDGACPFCIVSKDRIAGLDTHLRLNFVDLNTPDALRTAQPRFSRQDLIDEMHVHMPDGSWRIGFYGWAAVVGALPGMSWLAPLMMLPPVAEIGRIVYRAIASHRYAVSRILGMPAPCDLDGACRLPTRRGAAETP